MNIMYMSAYDFIDCHIINPQWNSSLGANASDHHIPRVMHELAVSLNNYYEEPSPPLPLSPPPPICPPCEDTCYPKSLSKNYSLKSSELTLSLTPSLLSPSSSSSSPPLSFTP